MAKRPVFVAKFSSVAVRIVDVEFDYHRGFAVSQKQKSIRSLHVRAAAAGLSEILEVSTKSSQTLGVRLSAFNLSARTKLRGFSFTVERAFQASKVFEQGGPYVDLLNATSREAKGDSRLRSSGAVVGFRFFGMDFPIAPPTYFYDWLYINTLVENQECVDELIEYKAFSDIEFNPSRSINCQAYSLALFRSMQQCGTDIKRLKDPSYFLEQATGEYMARWGSENQSGQTPGLRPGERLGRDQRELQF